MRILRSLLLLAALAMLPAGAYAQQSATITGQVVDQDTQQPLPGTQVFIVGTERGTLTDERGMFIIPDVPAGTYTLRVSRIGYREAAQEVVVGSTPVNVTIALDLDPLGLDEIVVIGYGQARRSNVAGAVSSMNTETIEDLPTPSINDALQGRLPGVQVVQNSGQPGSAISVRVRGASSISAGNEPLYVIDGVPMISGDFSQIGYGGQNTSALASLNPNDIASIEVLKDASAAAIYGSRASNGVVLITTKQGIEGEPQLEFSSYYGVQTPWKVVDFVNTDQYIDIYNPSIEAAFGIPNYLGYTNDDVENSIEIEPGTYTNWLEEVFEPAPMYNMSLSARGGSERIQYYVSGDLLQQDAIVDAFGYQRLSGRMNLDYGVSDRLDLATNVYVAYEENKRAPSDNTIYGPYANAIANPPYFTIYNEDGTYTETLYANPIGLRNENEGSERPITIQGNVSGTYAVTDALDFRTSAAVTQYTNRSRRYDSPIVGAAVGSNGEATAADAFISKQVYEGTLNYNDVFSDVHQFSGVVGTSYENNIEEYAEVTGSQFPTEFFRYIASAASITDGSSFQTEYALLSYFGRASYTYDDRYTATFNVRTDGSSRFGEDNRYGTFPSASLLWRVGQEDFMQDAPIEDLRLRVSYGRTGNQFGIGDFAARGLFGGGANYDDVPGIDPSQLANPDLRWETTSQLNLGTDFAVFDNRLSFTADYYIKKTDDLLVGRPIPRTTGFDEIVSNVGSIENRGYEIGANLDLFRGGRDGFNWSSQFNISHNDNEVTELYNGEPINFGFVSRVDEGEELGAFYGYVTDGIFNTQAEVDAHAFQTAGTAPGDIRFVDVNDDGEITSLDRTIIGSPWADLTGGWNNTMSFRGFDVTAFAQFSYGNEIYHATRLYTDAYGRFFDTHTTRALERWTPENIDATEPRATWSDPNNNDRDSDRFIEDGSYIRLKNAVLGYTFPTEMSERWGFDRLRLYVQGKNLLTFTDYSGFDPEVNYAGTSDVTMGTDFYTFPQARVLTAGVQIGF